jgi:hypothetical protein
MSAGGTSWGAAGVGVVGVGPQLGDDVGSLLQDLVMCSDGAGIPRSAAPGDAAQPPGPQVPQVRGYMDFTCRALSAFHPC